MYVEDVEGLINNSYQSLNQPQKKLTFHKKAHLGFIRKKSLKFSQVIFFRQFSPC